MKNILGNLSLIALVMIYFGTFIYMYMQKSALTMSLAYSWSSTSF